MLKGKKKVKIRRWRKEDIPAIIDCHEIAYGDYPDDVEYDQRLHEHMLEAFPEGQIMAEIGGKIVGYATSIIVQLDDETQYYTYNEITGSGTFSTHDPSGDTLYGADIAVHPDFRGHGIAGKLYVYRRKLMKRYNLRRMVAYGRLPGYQHYAGKITADEYVNRVQSGELKDPALTAHLKAGYSVKRVLYKFFRDDFSMNYCTLLEMPNPDFSATKRRIAASPIQRPVRKFRVCVAQYHLRRIDTWEEFENTIEFFVDTASTYHCHFLVMPELFTAQLFSTFPRDWDDRRSVEELANMADRYQEVFRQKAMQHGMYIIGGSHPIRRNGKIYNVAHLFSPAGNIYTQDKLHITPFERRVWGIEPGEGLRVFDTPLGRIAIQVCYDIEFPEVTRLLTLAGSEVIFVPFSTDEKKSYFRVRYAAHARAVENYLYVILAGNVGNLPTVRSYLINYGQSAVLTPSDFSFPLHGIQGEAEPNVETVVISELDLSSLAQQRDTASVRPLYDRRLDLFELRAKQKIDVVRVE